MHRRIFTAIQKRKPLLSPAIFTHPSTLLLFALLIATSSPPAQAETATTQGYGANVNLALHVLGLVPVRRSCRRSGWLTRSHQR